MLLDGCHEGKHTPRLAEVQCPACGDWVEVFIKMGGSATETGRLISDEICACGFTLKAGTCESDYKQ